MTPEEEAKQLQQSIAAAQAAGDIATILKLVASTTELTPADFISKTLGKLRYLYYIYLSTFHARPLDLIDMIDGILYIDVESFMIKKQRSSKHE